MSLLVRVIYYVLEILTWLIIADVILSYFPQVPQRHPIVVLIRRVTRPVVSPFRKIIPPQRMGDVYVDFSPILALLTIWLIGRFLVGRLLIH
jgi:YggT family protein